MGKTRKTYNSQTIAEVLLVILVIGIVVAAAMTGTTHKKTDRNWNADAIACIKSEKAESLDSQVCSNAIKSCRYDRNNACNTIQYYADYGGAEDIVDAAKKVFSNVCNQGGKTACQYFISSCQRYDVNCDNSTGIYDVQYYLNMPTSNMTAGRYLIEDLTKPYYEIGYNNIKNIVDNTCCTSNLINTACAINGVTTCPLQVKLNFGVQSQAYNSAVDSQGNIYIIGAVKKDDWDICVIKMNSSGQLNPEGFAKRISSAGYEVGSSIAVDNNDNIYFTAISRPVDNAYASYIFKMNSSGNLTSPYGWQKQFTSNSGITTRVKQLFVDDSNNIHLSGFENATDSKARAFYLKMSNAGVIMNQKRIISSYPNSRDYGYGMNLDDSGNVYIGIGSQSNQYSSYYNILGFTRMNSAGTITLQERIGTSASLISHLPEGVVADSNGNIYSSGATANDMFLIKMNSIGNISEPYGFAKRLDSLDVDYGYSITMDNNNNFYVTGYAVGDKWLVLKMNSSGNITSPYGWVKTFSSGSVGGRGFRIIYDNNESLYIAGYTTSDIPAYNIVLLRMNIDQDSDPCPFTNITTPYSITDNPFSLGTTPNFTTSPDPYSNFTNLTPTVIRADYSFY